MEILEKQPRLTIRQLQLMPSWPRWAEAKRAQVVVSCGEMSVTVSITLDTTELHLGRRWWCICPGCAARRYVLLVVHEHIQCRGCIEGGVLYLQQSWSKRFREEIGLPVLRASRVRRQAA